MPLTPPLLNRMCIAGAEIEPFDTEIEVPFPRMITDRFTAVIFLCFKSTSTFEALISSSNGLQAPPSQIIQFGAHVNS
jgi:hypothetical protein